MTLLTKVSRDERLIKKKGIVKVITLKATNIKAIKKAEIKPEGNLIFISGKNGQGKTSLMDCLLYALVGKKEIPSMPVRKGEDKGTIELDLGDLKVVRNFTEKGTYLKVTTKDGAEFKEGQSKLNNLVRSLYFDPLKFSTLSPKQQKQMLLELIGVEISKEEAEYTVQYQERMLIGRDGKQAKGELEGIEEPSKEILKKKEINITELAEQVQNLVNIRDRKLSTAEEMDKSQKRIEQLELQVRREKRILRTHEKETEQNNKLL